MEVMVPPTLTPMVNDLLADDDYRALQNMLMADPASGDIIPGGGGIRKMRFAMPGRGKSGGVRVTISGPSQKTESACS